jgi:TRAP-type C4-dicarboxylate transport system substrate-binding protein
MRTTGNRQLSGLTHHSKEKKIMKKKGLVIMAGIISLMFMFATSPVDKAYAAEKVINLKVANYFPPPSKQSKITEEFAAELQSRSGGRLKVQFFGGGSLLTGPAMFKGIETGITDIGYSHVYYTPGRMPVCGGIGLPIGTPTGWVAAHMAYDFYEKFKPKEFNSVRVLAIHGNAPSMIISNKPLEKLEDLKGVTIRAPDISGEIVAALGGTPSPTPMMEVYDAISKGVINGVWAPYETLKTFRFAEVAKYVTVCWEIGSVYPFYFAMNKNSYNKLPRDLQSLVDVLSGEYQERFALMWNEIELVGKAFGTEKGVKFIDLSEQETARWEKAVEPVIANYTKTMVGKGFSEAEVKGWIDYMRDRNKYWTEKQMEYKIPSPTGPAGVRPEALCK